MQQVTLFIVDDHAIVRDGLRALLESSAYEIVGEAGDGLEALERICQLEPDMAIIDIGLPGMNGIELARELRARVPHVRLVALSMQTDPMCILAMTRAGSDAYLVKSSAFKELETALYEVRQNRRYISHGLPREVYELLQQHADAQAAESAQLSARERSVLQLIAEGHTSKEIASRLFISARTVEWHRTQIMHKLHIESLVGLIKFAIRDGIVNDEVAQFAKGSAKNMRPILGPGAWSVSR